MTDSLIGISTKNFCVMCADANAGFSIIVMKNDEDKIKEIDGNKLLATNGENGARVEFTELIEGYINLYKLRNSKSLSTQGAASFIRGRLAYYLRTRSAYNTNILFAGHDKNGASLYFMDYLASLQKVKYAAQGYGQYFCLGLLDKEYRDDMTLNQAVELLKKCVKEIQKRFVLSTPKYICKMVDKNGTRTIEF